MFRNSLEYSSYYEADNIYRSCEGRGTRQKIEYNFERFKEGIKEKVF